MASTASAAPAVDPSDFLGIDRCCPTRSATIRDTVRAFVRDRVAAARRRLVRGRRRIPRELAPAAGQARACSACTWRATAAPGASATAYGLACMELEAGDSGVR